MHVDRTTKLLLLVIGLGLWAVAFAQFLAPGPAQAADVMDVNVNIAEVGGRRISYYDGIRIEGTPGSSGNPIRLEVVD